MLVIFTRTIILYTVVVVTMRIMGKRQIGELQPFELAIAILISELAAVPMQDTRIPLVNGIIPILTLLIAQLFLSFISLKSIKAREIICGKPNVLIENGKINQKNLMKEMYTLNDLLEQLRIKDYHNIADVEFAVLETNGQLSVIPKSQSRPISPKDLNIPTEYEGLSLDIVIDGKVNFDNLNKFNLSIVWLKNELLKRGIKDLKDVFYATIDTQGQLFVQKKERDNKNEQ